MSKTNPSLKGLMAVAFAVAAVGAVNLAPAAPPAAIEGSTIVAGQVRGKLYFPTGDPASSALLIEKSMPAEISVNKPFTYDIKVTNISKLKLDGVEVSETVPGSFKIKDVTEGSPDGKPNTVPYQVGSLEPGDAKIVRLTGTATQSGALPTCVTAKYNTTLCMSANVVAPALKLAITGSGDVLKNEPLAYKLTVTNSGSGAAKNVKVESVLPDGLVTPDGKAAVAFDAGDLAGGDSREFEFKAKANKTGSYALKATARADEGLTAEPATLNTAVKAPWLQIAKTGPEKAFIGQVISYEISVTNKGDGVAKDTVIYDNLPAGVVVQAATENARSDANGKVRWAVGDLKPGETKKVQVLITANQAGEMKSAASVSAVGAETQAAIVQTTLSGVPAIAVSVSDNPDPVTVNSNVTYTVEITNTGTAAGTNIKLAVNLEEQAEFVSATGPTKEKADGKTVSFLPVGSLAPKAKATYKIVVKAAKPGDTRFKTTITSDQLGRPVEQTEATNFIGQ